MGLGIFVGDLGQTRGRAMLIIVPMNAPRRYRQTIGVGLKHVGGGLA